MVNETQFPAPAPSTRHTIVLFVITSTVSLLGGWFGWKESSQLLVALTNEYVRISFDWMNLAIPGALVSTVTLAVLTTIQLVAKGIPLLVRKVSNVLLIAGVLFAIIGRIGGGNGWKMS